MKELTRMAVSFVDGNHDFFNKLFFEDCLLIDVPGSHYAGEVFRIGHCIVKCLYTVSTF